MQNCFVSVKNVFCLGIQQFNQLLSSLTLYWNLEVHFLLFGGKPDMVTSIYLKGMRRSEVRDFLKSETRGARRDVNLSKARHKIINI